MGDQGLVGVFVASTCALGSIEDIYRYYDNPDKHAQWAEEQIEKAVTRFNRVMALEEKPDFLCVGGSGTLVFQTPKIFRQLAFPAVKKVIDLADAAGMMTHVHSCGPERALVKVMAEETALTVIDPLEEPPMGDCNLAEIKRLWGGRLTLKGNLHTTRTMLMGTPDDVVAASRKAIDDAAEGGRFMLSTGDQCGRDMLFENLRAMIETAAQLRSLLSKSRKNHHEESHETTTLRRQPHPFAQSGESLGIHRDHQPRRVVRRSHRPGSHALPCRGRRCRASRPLRPGHQPRWLPLHARLRRAGLLAQPERLRRGLRGGSARSSRSATGTTSPTHPGPSRPANTG